MAAWKVAESLDRLLAQLNAFAPNRSKVSDGSIGDQAHASRTSDHNPRMIAGANLVTARDWTHDPRNGLNCDRLATALRNSRDARIKYVIWDRRIMSGAAGPQPWVWRPYTGSNPHTKHLHLSVVADQRCRLRHGWDLTGLTDEGDDMPLSEQDKEDIALRAAEAVWARLVTNGFGDKVRADQVLTATERRVADLQGEVQDLEEGP
jgi:hypothetical protein